jgi:hypothetical protein
MEQVLCDLVELTEFELEAVAGGSPFSGNVFTFTASPVAAFTQVFLIASTPSTTINNLVDNSVNVS